MWFYWLFWLSFRAECIKCFSSRLSVVSLQKKNDIVSLALALNAEYGFIHSGFFHIYLFYLFVECVCSACMVEYSIAFSFLLVNFTIVLFCKRVETWCNVSLRTFFNYYLMASVSAWHRNCLFAHFLWLVCSSGSVLHEAAIHELFKVLPFSKISLFF